MIRRTLYIVGAWTSLLLAGCSSAPSGPAPLSTWDTIQHDIFAANCVGCHTEGTSFARQSGLVLTPDAAYSQLVNAPPFNAGAAKDGLVRVSDQGLAGLFKSYLWEKINVHDQEHFYDGHPNYGEIMPLGNKPLTNGELEFIRQWIVAGAPENGVVADEALLQDRARYQLPPFAPLDQTPGTIQLHVGPFVVGPHFERELFYYMPLANDQDLYINRFEISMQTGTHHFIMYQFPENMPAHIIPEPETFRDLRDENGNYQDAEGNDLFDWRVMQYQTPIVIAQSSQYDFSLPPGIAVRLPAGTGIDLNSHYANTSDQAVEGEIYTNLHTLEPSQVEHVAEIFALSNFDIELPAGKVTTLNKEFMFKEDRHIIQLVSHTHERLTEFTAQIIGGAQDGELIYLTYDWEHPAPLRFDPPLFLKAGQGLRVSATYDNQTERDLAFGFTRADEMMILYGYYYTD